MSDTNNIRIALKECRENSNFKEAATKLLKQLGYRSKRVVELDGTLDQFIRTFPAYNLDTQSEQRFRQRVKSVHIVFQFTADEIHERGHTEFDKEREDSFIFVAVELRPGQYARGQYAEFTREINKRLNSPAVVLFRVEKEQDTLLTLSFIDRRPHKTDSSRDVLQKVSLLRDIDCADPHRGHLDILEALSLQWRIRWIIDKKKQEDFDGLLAAWLDQLDTDILSEDFYRRLFAWYERAQKDIAFPKNLRTQREDWIIRLITRILFIWFIKEQGLIHEHLFIEERIKPLLQNTDPSDDSYYRVVLQNLFFGTLNTPIKERRFSDKNNKSHRDFSLYRYRSEIKEGRADDLRQLFNKTPFINGGLFECLDNYDSRKSAQNAGRKNGERIDYFSDAHGKKLSIPNNLFFDDNGLISILAGYKFTVEESTPPEQEVALDPELLGKVFENLLAAYNPETRENVRKQTGSFYTPRKIVDYMVEQSLLHYLMKKVQPEDKDTKEELWKKQLGYLLNYHDALDDVDKLFSQKEKMKIIGAVSELRVLDPAVGSGAFPMGMLNCLNRVLSRIDRDNLIWKEIQEERATEEAKKAFEHHSSEPNFGRKLFLIQNSIFGVDIQPIACQIAKLRFFISLAIEQDVNTDKNNNYGIKPLPNLEARFVAADTLIKINERALGQNDRTVQDIESQLKQNREQYFNASSRTKKLECNDNDQKLRKKLAEELKLMKLPAGNADRVAEWDLYNQTASADWFDAEWMFGVSDGFDIVIGNPPYIQLQADGGRLRNKYEPQNFASFAGTGDVYMLFYERGLNLCRQGGALMFITSNTWMHAKYGVNLRSFLTRHNPRLLINMGKDVFDNAIVSTNILFVEKCSKLRDHVFRAADVVRRSAFPPSKWYDIQPENEEKWFILSPSKNTLRLKIKNAGTEIRYWRNVRILRGITSGCNQAFVIDNATKSRLCVADPASVDIIKPTIRGRGIERYVCQSAHEWVITTFPAHELSIDDYPAVKEYLQSFGTRLDQSGAPGCRKKTTHQWFETADTHAYYPTFEKEKLMWIQLVNNGRFAYDSKKLYPINSVFMMTGKEIKYLLAILNSRLMNWQMRYIAPTSGMDTSQWGETYVKQLSIPQVPNSQQYPLIALADKIIATKNKNPNADTSKEESEIDRLVYELYGLTEAEIQIIETANASWRD